MVPVMSKHLLVASLFCTCLSLNASAQERQWSLDASDEDAYLIFGVADSDDVGISLWCSIREGSVNIFVPETDTRMTGGQEVTMTLSASGQTVDIQGKTEENLEASVPSAEGKIAADDPFFADLIKADRFHVRVGGVENVFPLFDADVEGLLALCRKS